MLTPTHTNVILPVASEVKKPLKRKAPYQPPKPTKEQIAERQAMKQAKREAEAAAAAKQAQVPAAPASAAAAPKDEIELKKEGKVQEPRSKGAGLQKQKGSSKGEVAVVVKEGPPVVKAKGAESGKKRKRASGTGVSAA
jgi:hypothetical protein